MVKSHYRQGTYLQYSVVSPKPHGLELIVVRYGRTTPPMFTKLEYNCIKEDIKSSRLTKTCLSIVQRSGKATTDLQLHLYFSREGMYQFPREYHHKESTFGVIPSLCPVLRPIDPSSYHSAKWVQLLSGNIRRNFFIRLYISEDNFPTEDRPCSQGCIYRY